MKRALLAAGGVVGLLALVALVLPLVADIGSYKPRLEAAASKAIGMDTRLDGRLTFGFFPAFHVVAREGRILDDRGDAVASVERARLSIDLLRLLGGTFRLRRIDLAKPRLSVRRDLEGRLNIEKLKKGGAFLRALDGGSALVRDGSLSYVDQRSGGGFEAKDLDLTVRRIRRPEGGADDRVRRMSFDAKLACGEIRTKRVSVASLTAAIAGRNGVVAFDPVTVRAFGGLAKGSLRADLSGAVPRYEARASLPDLRIGEFLKILSEKASAAGTVDLSATLSMAGTSKEQLIGSATGDLSLKGERLTLEGIDIDEALGRFKSSQSFNLVDVGAVFLAGPLGVAVTKGYSFASLLVGSGGRSEIGVVVSDWRVARGVASAKDVAMRTAKNRIALQGGVDLAGERFVDMTVAVLDEAGCATIRQAIRGSFEKPEVEKPHFLESLAGPMVKIVKTARSLLPSKPCEPFYAGSVAPSP